MAKKTEKATGYQLSSIRKVMRIANAKKQQYMTMAPELIKECISTGNRKIGRVMNVSLMPIMTCANCKECMHFCYDIKACLQYPETVIDARMRNTCLMWLDRNEYFSRIENRIARRRKNKFFRWHVAGDIVDTDYLQHMIDIARRHPDFTFWTYTKNYSVVNEWIAANGGTRAAVPGNLSIMFSEWRGLEMVNPYGMPVFACRFPGETAPFEYQCPGNCDVCKASGRGCVVG